MGFGAENRGLKGEIKGGKLKGGRIKGGNPQLLNSTMYFTKTEIKRKKKTSIQINKIAVLKFVTNTSNTVHDKAPKLYIKV